MAKVIGFDETVKPKVMCHGCGAIIEYSKVEVQEYHGKDYSGGSDGMTWITCPNCGDKAIISSW